MKISIHIAGIVAATAAAFANGCAHAYADWPDASRSVAVSIAGVDLDTDAGRHIVFRRLQRAAKSVCEDGSFATVRRLTIHTGCVTSTLLDAIAQVKHPAFQAYAQAQLEARIPRVATARSGAR